MTDQDRPQQPSEPPIQPPPETPAQPPAQVPPVTSPPPASVPPTAPAEWQVPPGGRSDSYPISVDFDEAEPQNRLWGLLWLGIFVRAILLIPHYIILFVIGIAVGLSVLVTWIWILASGRLPDWAHSLYQTWFRWSTRVTAYGYLLTGRYPPFSAVADQPVRVDIVPDEPINRLWGIPIIGWLVRSVILIPHFIVLWILAILVGFILIFVWVPILISGRQADFVYTVVGGFVRWTNRVSAYFLYLTDRYPPFRLTN